MTRLFNYQCARQRKEEPLPSVGAGWRAEWCLRRSDAAAALPAGGHGGGGPRGAHGVPAYASAFSTCGFCP